MALVEMRNIKRLFGAGPSEEERHQLFREIMVMTLSRATDADSHTDAVEVATVQRILKEYLGEDISSSDIRVAALSELYEKAPLKTYLAKVGPELASDDAQKIAQALVDVLRADGHVRASEVEFFNMVVQALGLTPAEIAGLSVS